MSLKARIEAALFLTDKPIPALAVAQLVNADVQIVRQTILELIHDYEERNSALEIADDNGYMMQVKDEFATIANDIAPIDLPVSVVRTLSAIAIKQPVLQSEIVRIRGAGAYDHVKELLEKELITKKEEGRSSLLSTTKKFQEYFRLSKDAKDLRYQLKEQVDKDKPTDGTDVLADNLPLGENIGEAAAIGEIAAVAEINATAGADATDEFAEFDKAVPDQVAELEEFAPPDDAAVSAEAMDDTEAVDNLKPKDNKPSSSNGGDGFIEPPINALASSNI